jgi:hypothetical protein
MAYSIANSYGIDECFHLLNKYTLSFEKPPHYVNILAN